MRKRLGIIVATLFCYTGLVGLSRWFMQHSGRHLIILNYHRASGGNLRSHLLYLRRHYRLLHLEEALEELYTPTTETKRDQRTPLVLTFDDGYHDNYTHALPLARELQVPITIFLIPGYLESGDYFWWGEGRRLVKRATVDEVTLDDRVYHLALSDERDALAQAIDKRLRHASSVAERDAFLTQMRQTLAVPASATAEEEGKQPLTWGEVLKMQESGWISFGAHTMHHPVLAYLADAAELRREIDDCRTALEQRLGHPVRTFAYPVGRHQHISKAAIQAVQAAGYTWAVTTIAGVNTPQSDPYQLKRVLGSVNRHWLVMAAETSGIWNLLSPLWKAFIGKGESA
ncbi:MAG: polysaccharide deacetylase family protein [Chloroflexi bacterium]|nr:polysaccharide deacetylase family protein [Chloroflexota bacterium]